MSEKKPRLTPPVRSRIVSAIHAGAYPHVAAQANGIPCELFDAWLQRGTQSGAREPYASFARDVHIGVALARLKAESEVFQKDPKVWLEHGPGRETGHSPGWSSPVKPAEQESNDRNPFLDPALMNLFRSLLAALVPYPEARLHVADTLMKHGLDHVMSN
jgi:hypothetical protein